MSVARHCLAFHTVAFALSAAAEKAVGDPNGTGLSLLQVSAGAVPSKMQANADTSLLPTETQQSDIFMRYMPDEDVVVCGCGKCGSTSLFNFVYEQEFGKTWETKHEYPQEVRGKTWEDKFRMIDAKWAQAAIMRTAYSFALIRDPKERLVSAWKSKVACDARYGVDMWDRAVWHADSQRYFGFVPALQRLRGGDDNTSCLELDEYARALLDIKRQGRQDYLDRHFLPQHLGCFYRFPPSKWSRVAVIQDTEALNELAGRLGRHGHPAIPNDHSSPQKLRISEDVVSMLDEITQDEYRMLKKFLPENHTSKIVAGEVVLQVPHSVTLY